MEEKKVKFDENRVLLTIFSIITLVSIILIIFEAYWCNQAFGNSNIFDFRLTVTPEFITLDNPRGSIINPYFISESGSKIGVDVFPLKFPRVIKIQNKVINIETWDFEIYDVLLLKYTKIDPERIVQKAIVANLKIHIEEKNGEGSLPNSCFKMQFETTNATSFNKVFSGLLKPLTGRLYGDSYILPGSEIRVLITWEPIDKEILLMIYNEDRIENYLLEGGEWLGFFRTSKNGLNYLLIGNLDENFEINYSLILKPSSSFYD
ncbi:MAG: hypothetical protein RMI79_02300 [Nitrososphaerota archaeon]|nr:hypothetical protein [Nitrososphaerota archaeon]